MGREQFKTISLFSGGMGLDLGLEQAGLTIAAAVEKEQLFCDTAKLNRPDVPVIANDIRKVKTSEILEAAGLESGEAFAVVGGPPCQSFSVGGLRGSIQDERGGLFEEFLRVIGDANPLYFAFENVAHIVTAPIRHRPIADRPGQRWHLSSYRENNESEGDVASLADDEMSGSAIDAILNAFEELGYVLSYGVLNAADFGVPQKRLRMVVLGSRVDHSIRLPAPTHSEEPDETGLIPWVTLRDALAGLDEKFPVHANYTTQFKELFDQIPPGKNWRYLPEDVQRRALGKAFDAGGGKTGFFRRLSWDQPCPTILGKPNRKSGAICHPDQTRPLTVRESARVQGFPDDWKFIGGMHDQYLQIGNAVPVGLGKAIGRGLMESHQRVIRSKSVQPALDPVTQRKQREKMLEAARVVIRRAARNRVGQNHRLQEKKQLSLFPQ